MLEFSNKYILEIDLKRKGKKAKDISTERHATIKTRMISEQTRRTTLDDIPISASFVFIHSYTQPKLQPWWGALKKPTPKQPIVQPQFQHRFPQPSSQRLYHPRVQHGLISMRSRGDSWTCLRILHSIPLFPLVWLDSIEREGSLVQYYQSSRGFAHCRKCQSLLISGQRSFGRGGWGGHCFVCFTS